VLAPIKIIRSFFYTNSIHWQGHRVAAVYTYLYIWSTWCESTCHLAAWWPDLCIACDTPHTLPCLKTHSQHSRFIVRSHCPADRFINSCTEVQLSQTGGQKCYTNMQTWDKNAKHNNKCLSVIVKAISSAVLEKNKQTAHFDIFSRYVQSNHRSPIITHYNTRVTSYQSSPRPPISLSLSLSAMIYTDSQKVTEY